MKLARACQDTSSFTEDVRPQTRLKMVIQIDDG